MSVFIEDRDSFAKKTTARACIKALNYRRTSILLKLLLCGDLAFFILHFVFALIPGLDNPMFSVEHDKGYPELYQYVKYVWIIVFLVYLALKNRSLQYVSWALVFTYALADDSFQIHENVGGLVAKNLHFAPPFGLRLQDFGELAVSATAGVILLPLLVWAYKSGSQMFRKVFQDMSLLMLALAFFGVVVDMVHSATHLGRKVELILGFVEDGGEMLVVSFILWYVFLLKERGNKVSCYLCDLLRIVLTRRHN